MKKLFFMVLGISCVVSCRKGTPSNATPEAPPPPLSNHSPTYASLEQFYEENGVKMQTYSLSSANGGSFVSAQGTTLSIPANAFGNGIAEPVSVEFRDIYKKSDMLLSNMPTRLKTGEPLQSAGEFFIRVKDASGLSLQLAPGKSITVSQPKTSLQGDQVPGFSILPFNAVPDTVKVDSSAIKLAMFWQANPSAGLYSNATSFVFSLYSFGSPLDSGTWCNSDNSTFFNGYQQTTLNIHPTFDIYKYRTDVFLVFKTVNAMIHVYWTGPDYKYMYAPAGLQCTAVVVAVKNGVLYSSFTPITININQTIPVSLSETTLDDFKSQLKALD